MSYKVQYSAEARQDLRYKAGILGNSITADESAIYKNPTAIKNLKNSKNSIKSVAKRTYVCYNRNR